MTDNKMFQLADLLKALKQRKKELEEQVKDLTAEISRVDWQLVEEMSESETQNFTRNGTQFILTTKHFVSAAAGEADTLYQAMKNEGFGGLVKETVHPSTLNSFVREQIDENNYELPVWLHGLVNVFDKSTITTKNVKKN